jgi:hypothetical protein
MLEALIQLVDMVQMSLWEPEKPFLWDLRFVWVLGLLHGGDRLCNRCNGEIQHGLDLNQLLQQPKTQEPEL